MDRQQDQKITVKTWLLSMVGKLIDVVIVEKECVAIGGEVSWKGKGKVLRCVKQGAVLDLSPGASHSWFKWFSHRMRTMDVKHIVPIWTQRPFSVPYADLEILYDPSTREKQLMIDASTWRRSPEELDTLE